MRAPPKRGDDGTKKGEGKDQKGESSFKKDTILTRWTFCGAVRGGKCLVRRWRVLSVISAEGGRAPSSKWRWPFGLRQKRAQGGKPEGRCQECFAGDEGGRKKTNEKSSGEAGSTRRGRKFAKGRRGTTGRVPGEGRRCDPDAVRGYEPGQEGGGGGGLGGGTAASKGKTK